jgi:hypothetical protein
MSRKQGRSSAWRDQIESTLQRIHRQSSGSTVARPPDEASGAIGRGLATRLLDGIDDEKNAQETADKIVACVCEPNTSPSLSYAFFNALTPHAIFLEWMPRWILQMEEANEATSSSPENLSYLIRAYATCCCSLKNVSLISIADTSSRFKLSSSKTCTLREFVRVAFPENKATTMLTPFMASCVVNNSPRDEKRVFLQAVWREMWACITRRNNHGSVVAMLSWLSSSLRMFLNGIQCEQTETQQMSMELAYQWLTELVDMTAASYQSLVQLFDDHQAQPSDEALVDEFATLFSMIVDKILPHFLVATTRPVMESVIMQLVDMVEKEIIMKKRAIAAHVDSSTWFRLGTLALSTPIKQDVCGLVALIVELPNPRQDLVQGVLYGMACIFAHDDPCKECTKKMYALFASEQEEQVKEKGNLTSMIQLFQEGNEDERLLRFMTCSLENIDPLRVSAVQQNAALLLGWSLLRWKRLDEALVYTYLKALLQQFPHLGITLLPILFQSIQIACDIMDGDALLRQLYFLCDAVVKDPHCAQEVWNLVGATLVQPDSPTVVRSVAIRMYPRLCASNKRLYRRVIDTLGSLVDSSEPEIRLAVVSTIDELAREDRIRDVADVIGWIQAFLSDENSSVVHYAVLSLHHLVVAQELDFDLVVKVLNKRLCPVANVDQLLALPGTVLEALVLLLGDGECDAADSDEDDEATPSRDLVGVSPQVSGAVSTLIQLAGSIALSPTNSSSDGLFTDEMISHIRHNIYKSLSNYSLRALGLEDEGVRSATVGQQGTESGEVRALTETGLRYVALRRIASDGMQYAPAVPLGSSPVPTVSLVRKILALEEESLGSSVWSKGSKTSSSSSNPDRTSAPKASFSALPSLDLIHQMYTENPSFSTSVASLLCYSGNSVGDLFDFASDLSQGTHDPVSQVFNLQGWSHAMSRIWADIVAANDRSKVEAVISVVKEVNRWRGLLGSADISYLALAAFTMFVPDTLTGDSGVSIIDLGHIMESIRDDIWLAYEGHQFQSRDVANLCVGLIGVRAVHSRYNAFVVKSIETLEKSLREQGGQASFGACYGLALIAQTGSAVSESGEISAASSTIETLSWINRIAAMLVNEIQLCFRDRIPVFVTLVACLKIGKISPDLLQSITAVTDEVVIPDTSAQKVRSLLLSLALCIQAVDTVSNELMLSLYMFIEKLPWGTGKGYVLPNAALQCISSGMLRQADADFFIAKHESEVESLFEAGDSSGFNDALLASVAMKTYELSTKSTMDGLSFVRFIFENSGSCKTDESYSMLTLSSALLVSSFPCMGNGGPLFCSAASLHPQATKEMVSTIVSLLSDVAEGSGRNKSTGVATQLLGLLASLKGGPSNAPPCSIFGKTHASSETSQSAKQGQVSLEKLPKPQEGSILEAIMDLVQQAWGIPSSTTSLVQLLSCLESLSLPSHFARSLIEPMLAADMPHELKPACIALLISQVSGRRRAAFDGRDFVNLVSRLALLPPASFQSMVGDMGSVTFVSSLHSFLSKIPTDSVEEMLLSLWKIGATEIEGKYKATCAVGYLRSLSLLLEPKKKTNSSRLSPRTYTVIIQVLLQHIFPALSQNLVNQEGILAGTEFHDIGEAFLDCLTSIELPILEENKFLVLKGDKDSTVLDLSKTFWTVRLVYRKYFEQKDRASKELVKAIAWFAHQRGTTNFAAVSDAVLRELAAAIAIAAKAEDSNSKKDIVSLLFEALHVQGPGTLCLELLGMLLCVWSDGGHCDSESSLVNVFFSGAYQFSLLHPTTLANLSKLLLYNLPSNMGAYARSEKLRGLVSNRTLRIHKSWSKQGDTRRDLSILEGILIRCRTLDTKEHDLVSLVISRLTQGVDGAS